MTETYSKDEDVSVQQIKAAWASVRYSAKAVRISQIAAGINVLVVVTALGVVFFQNHLERNREIEKRQEIKSFILDIARDQISAYSEEINNDDEIFDISEHDEPADEISIKKLLFALQFNQKLMEQQRTDASQMFWSARDYVDLNRLSSALIDPFNEEGKVIYRKIKQLEMKKLLTKGDLAKLSINSAKDEGVQSEYRQLRLIYKMNTNEKGEALPGRAIFGKCSDDRFKDICSPSF